MGAESDVEHPSSVYHFKCKFASNCSNFIWFGIAGLVTLLFLVGCYCCCCRRKKKPPKMQRELTEPLLDSSAPVQRIEMQPTSYSNSGRADTEDLYSTTPTSNTAHTTTDAIYSTSGGKQYLGNRTIVQDDGHTSGNILMVSEAGKEKREPSLLVPRPGSRLASGIKIADLLPDGPVTYTLDEIKQATNNFDREAQIGVGACGPVFQCSLRVGRDPQNTYPVAVKCLTSNDPFEGKQFDKEIEVLHNYKHSFLLPLLGTCDGPPRCIVSELMTNGSLYHRLQYTRVKNMEPMTWQQRINVAVDTAMALNYLHNEAKTPLIHRDVKSLNILLDDEYHARLCDFGVVKDTPGLRGSEHTHMNTVHVSGTMAYMPREYCMYGEVTFKIDSFGFGVVLLELLSGRSPTATESSDRPLYAELEDELEALDDADAMSQLQQWLAPGVDWPMQKAMQLALMARSLLLTKRKSRAAIQDVLPELLVLAERSAANAPKTKTLGKGKKTKGLYRVKGGTAGQVGTGQEQRVRAMTAGAQAKKAAAQSTAPQGNDL